MQQEIHDDIESVLFSAEDIQSALKTVGRQLALDYESKEPLIVGVLNGAFITVAVFGLAIVSISFPDLVRFIEPVPKGLEVSFIQASSYGNETESSNDVDDIIDTGLTMQKLQASFSELGAASVQSMCLLDKAERRRKDINVAAKYVGLQCPNQFVVGYGLDYRGKYRSLPYIGVLKPHIYR